MKRILIITFCSVLFILSCQKIKKNRGMEIVQDVYLSEDSTRIDVEFDIQEIENTAVGICWNKYGDPTIEEDDFREVFLTEDQRVSFYMTELYAAREYHVRAYIYENEKKSSSILYSDDYRFNTPLIQLAPCNYNDNEIEIDGNAELSHSLFHGDNYDKYHFSCVVGQHDVDFYFMEKPGAGTFTTTKKVNSFGKKEVRIVSEDWPAEYTCDAGSKIYLNVINNSTVLSDNYSISFCQLKFTRFDQYGTGSIIMNGEINDL